VNYSDRNESFKINQVQVEFTEKSVSSWGGLAALLGKYLEQICFREWVLECVPIDEVSPNAKGIYEKVLAHFLTVLSGGERFSHLSWWGHGVEVLCKTFGVEWLPQSPSVITRFWNKISSQNLSEQLSCSARELAARIISWEGIETDNLNLDSSVITRYGKQEGAHKGYNPKKKGRPSHHPLLAFIGQGYVINLWNRPGDTWGANGAVEFRNQSALALPEGFKINYTLCDSGFYYVEFIENLEKQGQKYVIAVPIQQCFQKQFLNIDDWESCDEGIELADFYFKHEDEKWTKPRRYVVVRQHIETRPQAVGKQPSLFKELEQWNRYRFSLYISNNTESTPEEIWREYRPRAADENIIKELKESYGLASFNLKSFWATDAVMVMTALVFYNLMHFLNRTVLNPNTPKQQLKTIRPQWLIVPALLGTSSRRSILRIGIRAGEFRNKFQTALRKIQLFSITCNCDAVDTS